MAFPVILVDSTDGAKSDTACSGAGPATALFGATGVTSGTGLTVDLSADAPDLSGVATDGSAVLFMSDTTAGSRNFGKITAVDNGTKIVTVADAFQVSNTDAWAIGGKRASFSSTTSAKLFSNNSGNGDAMPGWAVELQSGHDEPDITANFFMRRAGDTTSGKITLRGESGAATMPIVTFTNNGAGLTMNAAFQAVKDIDFRNTHITKTASVAITVAAAHALISGVRIAESGEKFWKGVLASSSIIPGTLKDSFIANTASNGVDITGSTAKWTVINNFIKACGGVGMSVGTTASLDAIGNLIVDCTGDGITSAMTTSNQLFDRNTIDNCGGDGIEFTALLASGALLQVVNNIITNVTYGVNFSNGSITATLLNALDVIVGHNDIWTVASGQYNPTGYGSNDPNADPAYTNGAGNDYSVGTNVKAKGYPIGGTQTIGISSTYSYLDIGAAQREEPAGGGGGGGLKLVGSGGLVG